MTARLEALTSEVKEILDPKPRGVARLATKATIETYGPAEIAKPLAPTNYAIEGLKVARGAPLLLAGAGFIGKTVVAQSMILSLVSGKPVFDVFACKRSRALHIDLEQGKDLTNRRYQRLARAMGVDIQAMDEDRLRVAVKPPVRLDSPRAEDVYERALDGFDFVLLDCLRAAAPGADENSSDVRRYIDLLDRIAERTGSVVAIIHHTRKPSKDAPEGARHTIRGSSAIFDACGAVFVLDGAKGMPARVHHEKERTSGVTVEDFGLRIEDVAIEGDPRAGLRVVHLEPEQLAAAESDDPKLGRDTERLREHFRKHPVHEGNRKALRSLVGMNWGSCSEALSVLEARGEVVAEEGPRLRWAGRTT